MNARHQDCLRPTLLTAALALGCIVCAWQAMHAHSKAATESNARQEEARLREQAEGRERLAWQTAAEVKAVMQFFDQRVIRAARTKDRTGGLGKDVTLREALDAAEAGVKDALRGQPATEVNVRRVLGQAYSDRGEFAGAIRQFERVVEVEQRTLGPSHFETLACVNILAVAYSNAGQFDRSIPLLEEVRGRLESQVEANHADLLRATHNLAGAYQTVGRYDQAVPLFEETLRRQQASYGPEHFVTLLTMSNLAVTYDLAGDYSKAEELFRRSLALHRRVLGPEHLQTLETQAYLGRTLLHRGKHREAEAELRPCAAASARISPDDWKPYYFQSLLGGALIGLAGELKVHAPTAAEKELIVAERLELSAYQGMHDRELTMSFYHRRYVTETLERLVELYTALEQPADVAKWQDELNARSRQPPPERSSSCCGFSLHDSPGPPRKACEPRNPDTIQMFHTCAAPCSSVCPQSAVKAQFRLTCITCITKPAQFSTQVAAYQAVSCETMRPTFFLCNA
jgi:tetratricopeptide (TPR) repeat protein